MRIIRAKHLGMCFGVRNAIAFALREVARAPLTVLGELVHNETVLAQLRAAGVQFEDNPDKITTQTVMITAHGASHRRIKNLRERGLIVLEATCPLVRKAHLALASLANAGYHPVIIGKRHHTEVHGLTEDLAEFDIVLTEPDVLTLEPRARFGVIAQTTQPVERVRRLVGLMRARFPAAVVRYTDTVCAATKLRQAAAVELAQRCDVVVVIGGTNSNNNHELAATCRKYCPRVYEVHYPDDVSQEWFSGVETLGITAGTSTPDALICQIEERIRSLLGTPAPSTADAQTAKLLGRDNDRISLNAPSRFC